jgi:hypothetical protein
MLTLINGYDKICFTGETMIYDEYFSEKTDHSWPER